MTHTLHKRLRSCRRATFAACLALAPLATAMPAAAQESEGELPVSRIVMYNAGVSYFEHAGNVVGNDDLLFEFGNDDINDLLKSMVVRDLDGGTIASVEYEAQEPLDRILGRFAIDLNGQPTMAALLRQVQGQEVEILAPERLIGTVVGVENRQRGEGNAVVQVEYLTLLTEEGFRTVALEDIGRIRLTNEQLAAELRQALAAVAQDHDTTKTTVAVRFRGEGQRQVRVSYMQVSPIWKTSYRLVLNDEGQSLLQGWAIVENTTEDDWENVELSLVSGRPITFSMDLYKPLYAQRPEIAPPQFAMIMPHLYDQALQGGLAPEVMAAMAGRRAQTVQPASSDGMFFGADPMSESAGERHSLELMAESVQAAAQGREVGELFEYNIEVPVTIAHGASAMLPIVQENISSEKLAIYNASVNAVHPLDGLRLTNDTDLNLMAGPITVFDGGAYAGDSQIQSLAAGEERLLTYGMDLETEVSPESKSSPAELMSVTVDRGVVHIRHRYEQTITYTVKNSAGQVRELLIEQPIQQDWELIEPFAPAETTRSMYRFAVSVPAGETKKLVVRLHRNTGETVAITNLNNDLVAVFLSADVVSDDVKSALREIAQRKAELAEIHSNRGEIERQINVILVEQTRIRQNMEAIDRDTDLYRDYVATFTEQEEQLPQLHAQLSETIEQFNQKQLELSEYMSNLNLE